MRIYVGGSLRNVVDIEGCHKFVAALGRAIVQREHVLLNGCRNPIDKEIADGAQQWLIDNKRDPRLYVISYWQQDAEPAHRYGTVRASALPGLEDVTPGASGARANRKRRRRFFCRGGGEGTYLARNWAHWARKPILGAPCFGGAGFQIYLQELSRLRAVDRGQSEEYEQLNQVGSDVPEYATDLVALCERLLMPKKAFVIMSFDKKRLDVFTSYEAACQSHGFHAERTDKDLSQERINPRIEAGIAKSAFVIADVTQASPNVFFEVGFARGCEKHVIVTAEEGTKLPFDLSDVPVLFWSNHEELKKGLVNGSQPSRRVAYPSRRTLREGSGSGRKAKDGDRKRNVKTSSPGVELSKVIEPAGDFPLSRRQEYQRSAAAHRLDMSRGGGRVGRYGTAPSRACLAPDKAERRHPVAWIAALLERPAFKKATATG